MSANSQLLRGPKFSKRTQTYISEIKDLLAFLKSHPLTTRITLGVVKPLKGSVRTVKVLTDGKSIAIHFKAGRQFQLLYVQSTDIPTTVEDIQNYVKENYELR